MLHKDNCKLIREAFEFFYSVSYIRDFTIFFLPVNNCPDPVLPEGVELNCSDIDTLYRQCEVRCPAGHAFLHPMPQLLSCGPDGIWDPENPHNTFNIPHCGGKILV